MFPEMGIVRDVNTISYLNWENYILNTKMNKQLRQQRILQMLKEGQSKNLIRNQIKESEQVSDSTLDKDFAEVNKLIKESNQFDADGMKVLLNDRLELLYSKALQANKIDTALKIISEQSKLNGLLVDKQEVNVNDGQFEIIF